MTSSSFVSPLDCLTSFLAISLSRAVSSFGLPVYSSIHSRRITNVPKLAITAESYIRSWRKPPEMPEVCRMGSLVQTGSCRCLIFPVSLNSKVNTKVFHKQTIYKSHLPVFNDTVVKILAHDKGCETPLSLLDS